MFLLLCKLRFFSSVAKLVFLKQNLNILAFFQAHWIDDY